MVGSLVRSFSFRFLFWAKDKKRKEKKKETNSFFFSVDVAFLHRFHYCGIFFLFDGQRSHAPHLMFFFFYFFLSSRSGFFFVGSLIIRFISLLYCRFSFIADSSDVNQQLPLQKKEKNKKKTAGAPNQSGFGFFSLFFLGGRGHFFNAIVRFGSMAGDRWDAEKKHLKILFGFYRVLPCSTWFN